MSDPTNKKLRFWILVLNALSVAGLTLAIYLSYHFYQVRNGTAAYRSYCNISEKMNCDAVAASSYAEFLPGLPLSSVAAGWFLAFFLITLMAHNASWRREAIRASFILSSVGVLAAIPYLLIMTVKLKTFCLFCLILDGISLLSLFIVLILKPENPFNQKFDFPKWKAFSFVVIASILASSLTSKWMDQDGPTEAEVNGYVKNILSTPPLAIRTSPDYPSIGPAQAPITIIEYSDFQCPYCRIGAYAIHSAMNAHLNQVRIEFRNFPLDQACNPEMQQTPHPVACEAARVAVCAHKQGQFEPVYNEFFDRQASFGKGRPLEFAKALGLKGPLLESCLNDAETSQLINRDILEAISLQIKSTPTCFVNGYRVEGVYPVAAWNKLFDHLLAQQ